MQRVRRVHRMHLMGDGACRLCTQCFAVPSQAENV